MMQLKCLPKINKQLLQHVFCARFTIYRGDSKKSANSSTYYKVFGRIKYRTYVWIKPVKKVHFKIIIFSENNYINFGNNCFYAITEESYSYQKLEINSSFK